jgi:AcrR family transcriptional regulator
MPRLLDGETRTDDIIRGIGRLIVAGGLEAVTMRNIAKEVGVSTGTISHHYESRRRLMLVAAYWFGKDFVDENEARVRHEGPAGFPPDRTG